MTHTFTPAPVSLFHHPQLNDADAEIISERLAVRAAYLSGPQAGDWVRLEDGRVLPIAWASTRKYTIRLGHPDGLFYLESDGTMSYGGNFLHGVPRDLLHATPDHHTTRAWIMHHGQWGPRDQVEFDVELPVWSCPFVRTTEKESVS